ncbi:MAG: hypothetical protein HW374_632 [Bacteroidetes bacterium]|nr:hypothetical protein [Bacteroidota bacterium]
MTHLMGDGKSNARIGPGWIIHNFTKVPRKVRLSMSLIEQIGHRNDQEAKVALYNQFNVDRSLFAPMLEPKFVGSPPDFIIAEERNLDCQKVNGQTYLRLRRAISLSNSSSLGLSPRTVRKKTGRAETTSSSLYTSSGIRCCEI